MSPLIHSLKLNSTPYHCPRKSAFLSEFLISVNDNPTGLEISMSFSFSPPNFHTNRSLHLTNFYLKMFHVSVHCSPFPQLAFWWKYQNFISEIPDKELPMSGGTNASYWYTQDSPQFGLIPGGKGMQQPAQFLH